MWLCHSPSFYTFPHPLPHSQPPLPLDPSSQSGFTIVDSRPCMLLTRSTLRAPNPSDSPLLLPACGGLGTPCEAAATQARLSQLMQKQEKSFGKVTVYHRCTFSGRSALLASFKACQLFYLLKIQNIIVATALKTAAVDQLISLGATNTGTFFAQPSLCGCKDTATKGWLINSARGFFVRVYVCFLFFFLFCM